VIGTLFIVFCLWIIEGFERERCGPIVSRTR
jgi:hypothetical protein